jgi:hypothetical protein
MDLRTLKEKQTGLLGFKREGRLVNVVFLLAFGFEKIKLQ